MLLVLLTAKHVIIQILVLNVLGDIIQLQLHNAIMPVHLETILDKEQEPWLSSLIPMMHYHHAYHAQRSSIAAAAFLLRILELRSVQFAQQALF